MFDLDHGVLCAQVLEKAVDHLGIEVFVFEEFLSSVELDVFRTLPTQDVSEIGWRLSVLSGFPGLGMSIVLAIFHCFGRVPLFQHLL